jgi:RNA polymerase sigma factor (TIGR02999 family)
MSSDNVSEILAGIREGRSDAVRDLLPVVHAELRAMAHRRLGSGPRDVLLNTTALVNEAYLKLFGDVPLNVHDRHHFFSVAAIAMRQIIVDHARRRAAARRGGGARHVDLDDVQIAVQDRPEEIVALDEALSRLFQVDETLAQVVVLRFFAGLTFDEVAENMGISLSTVKRKWKEARALLYRELKRDVDP